MDCSYCKARGFDIEMLHEDQTGTEWPTAGCISTEKAKVHPQAQYSCPNCLSDFIWSKRGLRDKERT